jgi:hypothetical protein
LKLSTANEQDARYRVCARGKDVRNPTEPEERAERHAGTVTAAPYRDRAHSTKLACSIGVVTLACAEIPSFAVTRSRALLLFACTVFGGCSRAAEPSFPERQHAALRAPDNPPQALWTQRVVATGLINPRGMLWLADGSLLVAEAGVGDPANVQTGRVLRLVDTNHDGDYSSASPTSSPETA